MGDTTCPRVKNLLLLDAEGRRIAVKYFSPEWYAQGRLWRPAAAMQPFAQVVDSLCTPAGRLWRAKPTMKRPCGPRPAEQMQGEKVRARRNQHPGAQSSTHRPVVAAGSLHPSVHDLIVLPCSGDRDV